MCVGVRELHLHEMIEFDLYVIHLCRFSDRLFTFCFSFVSSFFFRCLLFAEKRLDFEQRRKKHYNEFEAVRLARQLMEQDELEGDGNLNDAVPSSS